MTDAAEIDRMRRRQGTRRRRTRWGQITHRVRLHRPSYLSLVDTLGQPLVRSDTVRRKTVRFTFFTIFAVLLVLVLITLPRPSFEAPTSTPPDLTSPDAVAATPTTTPKAPKLDQTPKLVRATTTAPTPSAVPKVTITPTASTKLAPVPGCPPITTIPMAIRIPSIAVSSRDVAPLGLNPDRSLAVPPLNKVDQLGWYSCSPVPGDEGPSVVVAHVDGDGKLGLFSKLGQLNPGDVVEIDRSDGQTATFHVTRAESFPKTEFAEHASEIYGNTQGAQLRLVTCTGVVDKAAHQYLSQGVVFASLVSLRPTVGD